MKRMGVLALVAAACAQTVAPSPRAEPALSVPRMPSADGPVARVDSASDAAPSPREPTYADHLDVLEDSTADQKRRIAAFESLRTLADPRSAERLVSWLDADRPSSLRTAAAFLLAELGDVRAVPTLAWRVGEAGGSEPTTAAWLLGDLVQIHPEQRASIAKTALPAVMTWTRAGTIDESAMRFMAMSGSPAVVTALRARADPTTPLPAEGSLDPLPEAWIRVQPALRWLGATLRASNHLDEPSRAVLLKQLERRPRSFDFSTTWQDRRLIAQLREAVSAAAVGAALGLAEWGDHAAFAPLHRHAADKKNGSRSRWAACVALAAVAKPTELAGLAAALKNGTSRLDAFCVFDALTRAPAPGADADLVPALSLSGRSFERFVVSAAIGTFGVDAPQIPTLSAMLGTPSVGAAAALALLLGGDEPSAAAGCVTLAGLPDPDRREAYAYYSHAVTHVTERALSEGHVARWIRNANACASTEPREVLKRSLVVGGAEPREFDGVVLRARALTNARSTDAKKRADALLVLDAMGARGGAP